MLNSTHENEGDFDTEHWYAIFSGWLIIPAILTVFAFLGAVIMVTFVNPTQISGFDLIIYLADLISLPILLAVFYTWIRRKRIFPILIIVFFSIIGLLNVLFLIYGHGFDFVNLAMSVVWIGYFIRSKRVKATFTE